MQHHDCLADVPDCWGKDAILMTDDRGTGVVSRSVATQARINMHMTVQSGAFSAVPTDEVPYQD